MGYKNCLMNLRIYRLEQDVVGKLAVELRRHALEIVALDAFKAIEGQTEQNWKCFDKTGDLFFFSIGYAVLLVKTVAGSKVQETHFCLMMGPAAPQRARKDVQASVTIFDRLLLQLGAKRLDY